MLVPITPFPNPTCTRVSLVANPRIALDGYLLQIISTNPGPLALWLLLLSIMNESERCDVFQVRLIASVDPPD